jgi:hypothetical protein
METNTLTFANLQKVFADYGKYAEQIYKYNLGLTRKNASRRLSDSTKYFVRVGDKAMVVGLRLEEYWKFVEYGRKPGKFPPPSAILKWIEVKPIIPRPDANGRIPSPRSLAYLIGRKIKNEGIDPAPILATTAEQVNAKFMQAIRDALKKDFGDALYKIVKLI